MGDNRNSSSGLVTDKQVRRLFALVNQEKNHEMAAVKAGMDRKTATQVPAGQEAAERIASSSPVANANRSV